MAGGLISTGVNTETVQKDLLFIFKVGERTIELMKVAQSNPSKDTNRVFRNSRKSYRNRQIRYYLGRTSILYDS